MPRFDLDAQRTVVCLVALTILVGEFVSVSLGGKALSDAVNGVLGTLAAGPFIESALRRGGEAGKRDRRSDREDPQK